MVKIKLSLDDTPEKKLKKKNLLKKNYMRKIKKINPKLIIKKHLLNIKIKASFSFGKFLSYILVFIISLIALIIFLDTLKYPLSNFFPNLELMLYNLYEVLKDIKSFIIDLT